MKKIILSHLKASNAPIERCSKVLLSQLAHMPSAPGMNYPFQFVLHEIMHLEGLGSTQTKPASPFTKNGALQNFMHKHFFVPSYDHLAVNAMLTWKMDNARSKKFEQMAMMVQKKSPRLDSDEDKYAFSCEVAKQFMLAIESRRKNEEATGDWLIYTNHQGQNYYLCIARHDEDKFILEALKACVEQFPFIRALLPSEENY